MQKPVVCPWCSAEFEIDLSKSALPYECPGCCEKLSAGSLLHPNFDSNALEISHGQSLAAAQNLHRFSLAYVYRKDADNKGASGTLVTIGRRLLMATTAHSIPSRVDWITPVPKLRPDDVKSVPSIIRLEKNDDVDVGLVELDPAAAFSLGMESITLDRVSDLQTGRHNVRAWLIGYPAVRQVKNFPEAGVLGFQGLSISCEPIDPIAWGSIPVRSGEQHALREDRDVMIHYSLTEPLFVHADNVDKHEFAPDPRGVSGGGLWQCRTSAEGRIWSAEELCLIAIQSNWPKFGNHLQATQIVHWLRLVAATYPDLADEITERFPRATC